MKPTSMTQIIKAEAITNMHYLKCNNRFQPVYDVKVAEQTTVRIAMGMTGFATYVFDNDAKVRVKE